MIGFSHWAGTRRWLLSAIVALAGLGSLVGSGGGGGDGGGVTPVPINLTVSTHLPSAGASGVATSSSVSVSYSEALSISPSITVSAGTAAVAGSVSRSGATATFTSSAALPAGSAITVTVSGAVGASGATQGSTYTFSFATLAATNTVTVSGKAEYESVPANTSTGGLNYAAASFKPIRAATVQIIGTASGATLASGTTDTSGNYSLSVSGGQAVFVRVRAESIRTGSSGGSWDYTVRDNTSSDAVYALDGSSVTLGSSAVTVNLRAGSGWNGSSYAAARSAAPFAVLDVAYEGTQKVLATVPNSSFPALRLFWSVNNRASTLGGVAVGDIGTSFYQFVESQHRIYILGAADSDTDEYDRTVLAHEFGHYLQSAFSRNDSIGGAHGSADRLDMRVAFGEGFGNAWSGMLFATPFYTDSVGSGQRQGGVTDLSQAPTSNRGWFSEDTVQYLLYSWHADALIGFAPIWEVLRTFGTSLAQQGALTSLHSFAHQLKLLRPARAAAIDSALAGQLVTVADALGSTETNSGAIASSLPIYHSLTLGVTQNVCVSDAAGTSGDEFNKLGATVFLRFNLASAGSRTLTATATTAGGDSDPDFTLTRPDSTETTHNSGTTATETAVLTLSAGWHVMALNDYNLVLSTSASTRSGLRCFNVTVQ